MIRLFFFCLLAVALTSCSKIYVASVSSENIPVRNDGKVIYENDTLRIGYVFWDRGGAMNYSIYNKLNEPLYIDWKNSAFIPNDKMMTYWQDETNTEGVASTSGYSYKGLTVGSARVQTKAIHQERIAVIPPHSLISKKEYTLIPKTFRFSLKNAEKKTILTPLDSSKTLTVYGNKYDRSNSPVRFRNYITYSTSEKMDGKLGRVDNDFFVSDVWSMKEEKMLKMKANNNFFTR